MTSKAIFTIVTSNYIPMANILGDSISLNQPDTNFMVFVINGFDKNHPHCECRYKCIPVEDLGIERLSELAFKYDLTEFCTAIKPKCFEYVFSQGYKKIIFFDPDIYVFSSLEPIFSSLDTHFLCFTPHILYPELNYTGHWPQGRLLAAGIFNLGFVAINKTDRTDLFLKWWDTNLREYCYSERSEGFFTDQKWMNLCPVYFPETEILRNPGCNVALWNIHEREIVRQEGRFNVKKRNSEDQTLYPVAFFHFSNFRFRQAENDINDFLPFSLRDCPDIVEMVEFYRSKLIDSEFAKYNKLPDYKFNYFENGIHVNKIHRRLFRKLLQNGVQFNDPFSSEEGTFYSILKKNKLVAPERQNFDTVHLRSTSNSSGKFKFVTLSIRTMVRVIGIKRYTFLCRFLLWLTKYENQLFLIKDFDHLISDKAPKGYINTND